MYQYQLTWHDHKDSQPWTYGHMSLKCCMMSNVMKIIILSSCDWVVWFKRVWLHSLYMGGVHQLLCFSSCLAHFIPFSQLSSYHSAEEQPFTHYDFHSDRSEKALMPVRGISWQDISFGLLLSNSGYESKCLWKFGAFTWMPPTWQFKISRHPLT